MSEQSAADLINVPQGGGALAGIGETFQPDLQTGTGNFHVPIELPAGRGGFGPTLALAYSTGSPNGPFGLGWSLTVPQIRRKTSQGVPTYHDDADVFVLSGAEDLVPIDPPCYRPRTESAFARIAHVVSGGSDYWEVWSKDGLRSRYGTPRPDGAGLEWCDPAAIICPGGAVFTWLISETLDLLGNRIDYSYAADPGASMRYLTSVAYADYGEPAEPEDPLSVPHLVTLRVSYDESRPDPFSDFRPGFELRTRWRAARFDLLTGAQPAVSRTINLSYETAAGNAVSLLSEIVVTGVDGADTQQAPPIELGYTTWAPASRRLERLTGELPLSSIGTPGIDLVDVFGDGTPSIVELNGSARYWRNRGDGSFEAPRAMRAVPAGGDLARTGTQFADMDGDGRPDLVISSDTATGYWRLADPVADPRGAAGFDPAGYVAAAADPPVSLSDPSVRMIDLDGDGRMDVLYAGAQLVAAYNDGNGGFSRPQVLRPDDVDLAELSFADPRVRLADMNGDGLTDILLLHAGSVCYWPNRGHGQWGERVWMKGALRFADGIQYDVTGFDSRRLLVGDIDGDGAADLVYVGDGHVTVWVNQSGNAFADPVVIPGTPSVDDTTSIRLVDLHGRGIAGVLWSANALTDQPRYEFLDLTGAVKPYLLSRLDNHRGAVTEVTYRTSSDYAQADRAAGRPWRTTLPFPVHVVASTTTTDVFSSSSATTEYSYHHGYWDGADREFRGFARVEHRDAEVFDGTADLYHSPPTETRTWFHVGPVGPAFGDWAPLDLSDEYWSQDRSLLGDAVIETGLGGLVRRQRRDACRALRGVILRTEFYGLDEDPTQDRPYVVTEHQYEVTLADPAVASSAMADVLPFFPHPVGERTTEWERGSDPRTRIKWTDGYDGYGRPRCTLDLAVPRGRDPSVSDDSATDPYLATLTTVDYLTRDDGRYICDRVARTSRVEVLNDGRLPVAELHSGVVAGGDTFYRPLSLVCTSYDGQALGQLGDWGLATGTEHLAITLGQLALAYASDDGLADPPELPAYLMVGDAAPSTGVRAAYYSDTDLQHLALVRPEPGIDCRYGGTAPDPVLDPRGFSVRWTATITPRYSENYTFAADCIGGVRISVDGDVVLDDWTGSGTVAPMPVALTADRPSHLVVEYTSTSAQAAVTVTWSSASQAVEPLPTDRLVPPDWGVAWPSEYPQAFRAAIEALPGAAGYTYHGEDARHWSGYYVTTARHYDVQDDPAGRGLMVWQQDALGNTTQIVYDDECDLLPAKVIDPAGLSRAAVYDYRLLKPKQVTDANGNQTFVGYTPLGLPAWIEVSGKPGEDVGDSVDHPGTSFTYGLTAYDDSGLPAWVHTVARVDHAWTLIDAEAEVLGRPLTDQELAALLPPNETDVHPERFIQRREYSDGFGRLLQSRKQADDLVVDDLGLPVDARAVPAAVTVHAQDPSTPRVTISGWQAYDNKGRVVQKWEPFFDQGWDYQAVTGTTLSGLASVTTFYDPRDLLIKTVSPDGSETRTVPGIPPDLTHPEAFAPTPWETYTYDPNDNAGRTDPTGSASWQTHWNTPSSELQDALGRVLTGSERTATDTYVTSSTYDIEGSLLAVIDPLGRTASSACYDALKRPWRTTLLDGGTTRSIFDPMGGAIEARDGKDAVALTDFDESHRRRRRWARDGETDSVTLREVHVYGEHANLADASVANLLGRLYATYDEAGVLKTPSYDFHGNVLEKQRIHFAASVLLSGIPAGRGSWAQTAFRVDWEPPAGQTLDAHAHTLLDSVAYGVTTAYDALNRPKSVQGPLDVAGNRSTLTFTYDPAGAMTHIERDGTTYLERSVHNARGQRELSVLGNGVMVRHAYDPQTFRLARLRAEPCTATGSATAPAGWKSTGDPLQDHGYSTYDQAGNLWSLLDTTPGSGAGPGPADVLNRAFAYDELYRLTSATGREATVPFAIKPWLDDPPGPTATSVRAYAESYTYDPVGNLIRLKHNPQTADPGYTRTYTQVPSGNRLARVAAGNGRTATYRYSYDAAGNLLSETASRRFEWDHENRLATFRNQATATSEPSVYAQYRYDAAGQRVLKLVRHQGGQITVTVYIDGLFERLVVGSGPSASRHDTFHVMDGTSRIALVRVGDPAPGDSTPAVAYQLGDHLGSSEVVLDVAGGFVRREEFSPYGETTFGGYTKKRYRFTGKQRDEESSLYYHGARYYAPWLARWTSIDPIGLADGLNLYRYVGSNPIRNVDASGRAAGSSDQLEQNVQNGRQCESNQVAASGAKGKVVGTQATVQSGKGGSRIDIWVAGLTAELYWLGTIEVKALDLRRYMRQGKLDKAKLASRIRRHLAQVDKHVQAMAKAGYFNPVSGGPIEEALSYWVKGGTNAQLAEFRHLAEHEAKRYEQQHGLHVDVSATRFKRTAQPLDPRSGILDHPAAQPVDPSPPPHVALPGDHAIPGMPHLEHPIGGIPPHVAGAPPSVGIPPSTVPALPDLGQMARHLANPFADLPPWEQAAGLLAIGLTITLFAPVVAAPAGVLVL